MHGVDGSISFHSSIGRLRATYIHLYIPVPIKYLLFRGLEFEKVLIEEVAAGRRAVACRPCCFTERGK